MCMDCKDAAKLKTQEERDEVWRKCEEARLSFEAQQRFTWGMQQRPQYQP